MPDLAQMRVEHAEALDMACERLREGLARIPEVRLVVLFGSFGAGRRDLCTDLDVLVVMDSSLDFVTRTAELYRQLHLGVDLDLVVYTPAELARMAGHGFVRRALAEGKVIYEKDAP